MQRILRQWVSVCTRPHCHTRPLGRPHATWQIEEPRALNPSLADGASSRGDAKPRQALQGQLGASLRLLQLHQMRRLGHEVVVEEHQIGHLQARQKGVEHRGIGPDDLHGTGHRREVDPAREGIEGIPEPGLVLARAPRFVAVAIGRRTQRRPREELESVRREARKRRLLRQ